MDNLPTVREAVAELVDAGGETPEAIELKEVASGLPQVDGHEITPNDLRCFFLTREGQKRSADVAAIFKAEGIRGYSERHIFNLKRTAWWRYLDDEWFAQAQKSLRTKLAKKIHKMEKAFDGVMDGDEEYQRSGNAVIRGIQLFSEMGADPLISKKPGGDTFNTLVTGNEIKVQSLADMSPDAVQKMVLSGKIPQGV